MSGSRFHLRPMDEVHMIGKLADMKDEFYKHSLMLSAITELLIEKGIVSADELQARATHLDLIGCLDALSGQSH